MLEAKIATQRSDIQADLRTATKGTYMYRLEAQVDAWIPLLKEKYPGLQVVTTAEPCAPGSTEMCRTVSL